MPSIASASKLKSVKPSTAVGSSRTAKAVVSRVSSSPTSLKLPTALKTEIEALAHKSGVTAHAFMVQTLVEATERARQREQFQQDSLDALRDMKKSAKGHELADVRQYFSDLAAHRRGQGAKPSVPALKKIA